MPRTNPTAVIAVMQAGEKDYDGKTDLTPFIEMASDLVDAVVANGRFSRTKISLGADQQTRLETLLAAAMYCYSDRQKSSQNAGRASATYMGDNSGAFLEATSYGRLACMYDVSRVLKPLVEGRIAGVVWLGKVKSDQIPYCERN